MKTTLMATVLAISLVLAGAHAAEPGPGPAAMQAQPAEDYVPSLITDTPLQGRQLAITLVRRTIGSIQRDADAKQRVRERYEEDPALLMQAAAMVTAEFRIIAEANDYWRDRQQAPAPGH